MTTAINSEKPHKFETLDALRGLAAIAVLTGHVATYFGPRLLFPHAYLAVDFFFMLSGFVLTFAYQQKLDAGLTTFDFFKARIIRLYPLYAIGITIGLIYMEYIRHKAIVQLPAGDHALIILCAIFFLPVPAGVTSISAFAFPLDAPTWSLFFELIANLLHALLLRRQKTRTLLITLIALGALLVNTGICQGSVDFGTHRGEFRFGLLRVAFSYLAGMLLFRLWNHNPHRVRISAIASCLLLLAALAVPRGASWNGAFDVTAILIWMPLVLLTGAYSQPHTLLRGTFLILGTTSYALYVLHFPAANVFARFWKTLAHQDPAMMPPWSGLAFLTGTIAACLILDRCYDLPVRRMLRK